MALTIDILTRRPPLSKREKEIQVIFKDTLKQFDDVYNFWSLLEQGKPTENEYPKNGSLQRHHLAGQMTSIIQYLTRDNYEWRTLYK